MCADERLPSVAPAISSFAFNIFFSDVVAFVYGYYLTTKKQSDCFIYTFFHSPTLQRGHTLYWLHHLLHYNTGVEA